MNKANKITTQIIATMADIIVILTAEPYIGNVIVPCFVS